MPPTEPDVSDTVAKRPRAIAAHAGLTLQTAGDQGSVLRAGTGASTATGPQSWRAHRGHRSQGFLSAAVHVPTSQFLPHPNITFIDVYKSSHLHKHIYFKRKLYITARNEKPGSLCH